MAALKLHVTKRTNGSGWVVSTSVPPDGMPDLSQRRSIEVAIASKGAVTQIIAASVDRGRLGDRPDP